MRAPARLGLAAEPYGRHQQQLVSRQYRVCVTMLRDELGVPPGAETVQLFRRLTSAPQGRF
jgi:hypothetical protein